jgi:hypothetical protein
MFPGPLAVKERLRILREASLDAGSISEQTKYPPIGSPRPTVVTGSFARETFTVGISHSPKILASSKPPHPPPPPYPSPPKSPRPVFGWSDSTNSDSSQTLIFDRYSNNTCILTVIDTLFLRDQQNDWTFCMLIYTRKLFCTFDCVSWCGVLVDLHLY